MAITDPNKKDPTSFSQAFSNAEATRARGGMRPPITNAPTKKLLGDSNQRNQAAAGTQGTITGDMSGTGANSLGNIKGEEILKGIRPNLFQAPANTPTQASTIPTQPKSIEGTINKAVAQAASTPATSPVQSLARPNTPKGFDTSTSPDRNNDGRISGEEQYLFENRKFATPEGKGYVNMNLPGAQEKALRLTDPSSAIHNQVNQQSSPVSAKLGETNLTQNPDGTLNISSGSGRGTIRFSDGRTLNEAQLGSLAKQMEFNRSPEGQASFAKNAALNEQRAIEGRQVDARIRQEELDRQNAEELNAAKAAYYSANTFAGKSLARRNLETLQNQQTAREKLGAEAETTAANLAAKQEQTGFEARKYAGESAFKGEQEQNKANQEAIKLVTKGIGEGTMNPTQAIGTFQSLGVPVTSDKLSIIFSDNPDVLDQLKLAKSPDEFAGILSSNKITDPAAINSLTKSYYGI